MTDLAELLKLPVAERLQLVEAIWNSLAATPEVIPVSDALREELERRLKEYEADPSSARPWEEVEAELFPNKRAK